MKKLSPLAQPSLILEKVNNSKIYISSKTAAYHQPTISNLKITHIIAIHQDAKPMFEKDGVTYFLIKDVDDKADEADKLRSKIPQTNEFIHSCLQSSENRILIHCNAGASRSVSLAAFYLKTISGLDSETVLEKIKQKRIQTCPNEGFKMKLNEFDDAEERSRLKIDKLVQI